MILMIIFFFYAPRILFFFFSLESSVKDNCAIALWAYKTRKTGETTRIEKEYVERQ